MSNRSSTTNKVGASIATSNGILVFWYWCKSWY